MKKLDIHVHAIPEKGPRRPRGGTYPTPEELREMYRACGISGGVLMPLLAPEHMHDPITSRMAEDMARDFPDVFRAWFCYLDPRMGTNSPQNDFSYYIGYYRERGAKGVGEEQAGIWLDDPRMQALFAACEKEKTPVTVHVGRMGGRMGVADTEGLPRLDRILSEFPRLILLGHAEAFWQEFLGTGERMISLMRAHPGLYCDLSAGSGYRALSENPEKTARFLTEFSDRCVFGTDFADADQIHGPNGKTPFFLDSLYESGMISQSTWEKVCYRNAEELLLGVRTI